MKIVAVDPGTSRTGYAVFDVKGREPKLAECGVIFVRGADLPAKLLHIHRGMDRLFRRHRPREVVIERPFVGKNVASALVLGAGRAVCMLAAAAARARCFDYAPTEVKRAVSTNGLARKGDIQRSVQLLLGLRSMPLPDAADAIALAICHLHRTR